MSEIDALMEEIGRALDGYGGVKAKAALTELAERAKEAEKQLERSLNWREYDAALTRRAKAAEAQVQRLREALTLYADENNWYPNGIFKFYHPDSHPNPDSWFSNLPERGYRARIALSEESHAS